MEETQNETRTAKIKVDVSDVVIATTAVVLTVGVLRVAAGVVVVPLQSLTKKLKKKNEETNTK